jgi:glyoxylase-like metal-dependent hydrolase (beta-lactamase superfamily II)
MLQQKGTGPFMRAVAAGLWQLMGFPRNMFNVYLAGDVLFDTATRWARWRILRQLHGRSLALVALTHCHPDHQGTAAFLCRRFRVPLACHEADVPAMETRGRMLPRNRVIQLGEKFWAGPPYKVERPLRDGDEVAGWHVIHSPGHTPGHVMYFRPADRVVIAGDLLANIHFLTGEPGLREPPGFFSADPDANRRSLQKLIDLQPSVVCFGHGPPLADPDLLLRYMAERDRATVEGPAAAGGTPLGKQ